MNEFLLTYLWTGIEFFAAVLLFDGFSDRKLKRSIHWMVVACFTILCATVLNQMEPGASSLDRMLLAGANLFAMHSILYQSGCIFRFYIIVIYYATVCSIDNLYATIMFLLARNSVAMDVIDGIALPFITHCTFIFIFYLHYRIRKRRVAGTTSWKWYTVPSMLSIAIIALIFFFGSCFQKGQMSEQPLVVCATFVAFMQTGAMFLVSWMEQNARFREETLGLQTRAQAQQQSIEALSAAYGQQRKLTHDFQAHLDILADLLTQEPQDAKAAQKYIDGLRAAQTSRILLVNTHHGALDALLNQKGLVAKKRKIDIQFSVNDLSAVKINMVDLTILISNTLDNAIEACEKLPDSDRQIFVKLLLEDDILFYSIRNRSLPVKVQEGQLPVTTKEPSSLHGYGLQNVQTILKRYHSLCAINYADGWFGFATDLPNKVLIET